MEEVEQGNSEEQAIPDAVKMFCWKLCYEGEMYALTAYSEWSKKSPPDNNVQDADPKLYAYIAAIQETWALLEKHVEETYGKTWQEIGEE